MFLAGCDLRGVAEAVIAVGMLIPAIMALASTNISTQSLDVLLVLKAKDCCENLPALLVCVESFGHTDDAHAAVVNEVLQRRHPDHGFAGQPGEVTLSLERSSDLALVFAYVISISLYVHILSAFVLASFHADNALNESLLSTAVITIIVAVGISRGLNVLDVLERWALYVTFLIILLLVFGFGYYDWMAGRSASGITLPKALDHTWWEILTIVAGTLIVVQGFETTRYLGSSYDAAIRISASRWSQIVSTGVYLVFVALALPIVHTLNGKYDDDSLIALVNSR